MDPECQVAEAERASEGSLVGHKISLIMRGQIKKDALGCCRSL